MKKLFLLVLTMSITMSLIVPQIKVKESKEKIGGGKHNALVVTLYRVNTSDAEAVFKSFMQKYEGKNSSKDGEIVIRQATIKEMSDNTINIYGKAKGKNGDTEIKFCVAFDLGVSYLNSSDHKAQYKIAKEIVIDFAKKATKKAAKKI